ncbi:MAG: OstA-like protein [Flavobacteriales bacterium]
MENEMINQEEMIKTKILFIYLFLASFVMAQQTGIPQKKKDPIEMEAGLLELKEQYPDLVFATDSIAVVFKHQGSTMTCDSAVFNEKEQYFEAFGNVKVNMGDTVFMDSDYLDYDGTTKFSKSRGNVVLKNRKLTLETQELFYDRIKDEAYYNNWGTVRDEDNTMVSKIGTYYITPNRAEFLQDVNVVTNINNKKKKNFIVNSPHLIYYPKTKDVDFLGNTTIEDNDNPGDFIFTEIGTYNTRTLISKSTKNGSLHYDGNTLKGDELYFDQKIGYGKADGNVRVERPKERIRMKSDHGEYFRSTIPTLKKDSIFLYSRAYAAKAQGTDSVYFNAKRIEGVQHPDSTYTIRGFTKARSYNIEGQAKADSLIYHNRTGIMELYKDPVLWYGENQITGDTIRAYSIKNKIDSAVVIGNAMTLNKVDSIYEKEYNQLKGRFIYATFRDKKNDIDFIHVEGNAQSLIYADEEKKEGKPQSRIGINRSDCAYINAYLQNKEMEEVSCMGGTKSILSPEEKIFDEDKYLKGFTWRGKEMFADKQAFLDYVQTVTDDVEFAQKQIPKNSIEKTDDTIEEQLSGVEKNNSTKLGGPALPKYFFYDTLGVKTK